MLVRIVGQQALALCRLRMYSRNDFGQSSSGVTTRSPQSVTRRYGYYSIVFLTCMGGGADLTDAN